MFFKIEKFLIFRHFEGYFLMVLFGGLPPLVYLVIYNTLSTTWKMI